MKKVFAKTVALLAMFGLLSGTAAMAADPIEVYKNNDLVTVKVSELEAGEETSLLVTKNAKISEAFADTSKVYHIDQVAADSEGESTFTFAYTGTDTLIVYSGYATMSATDEPYEVVLDESTPPAPGADFTYGDVNNDTEIDVLDASSIISYVLYEKEFTDAATGEVYAKGEDAADVTGEGTIDVLDASSVVSYVLFDEELPVNSVSK